MLPKKRRVSTPLFEEIVKSGTTYHSPHLSLKILRNTAQNVSRFSVAVPKKVEKQAVVRNSLKRSVFRYLALVVPRIPSGFTGVLFVKKGFGDLSPAERKEEVIALLQKALNISLL
jgi:ribonuclease P protein component